MKLFQLLCAFVFLLGFGIASRALNEANLQAEELCGLLADRKLIEVETLIGPMKRCVKQ